MAQQSGYPDTPLSEVLNEVIPAGRTSAFLCAPGVYAPSSQVQLTVSSTTLAAFNVAATTVASGSNGGEISTIASWSSPSGGVLDVATTAGWPSSGTVTVAASGPTTAIVTYTGTSGGNQLTGCAYVSGSSSGTVATGGAVTLTSVALQTGTFTAPPSGSVVVGVSCAIEIATGGDKTTLALAAAGTVTPVVGYVVCDLQSSGSSLWTKYFVFVVTGLTPGSSYQFQLVGATAAATTTILAYGNTSTSQGSSGAPVVMTVQAV